VSGGREDSARYSYTTARVPEGWLVAIDDLHKHEWRNEAACDTLKQAKGDAVRKAAVPLGFQLMNVQRC
jgi:hypothetical protein